jgi:hypothetical protein
MFRDPCPLFLEPLRLLRLLFRALCLRYPALRPLFRELFRLLLRLSQQLLHLPPRPFHLLPLSRQRLRLLLRLVRLLRPLPLRPLLLRRPLLRRRLQPSQWILLVPCLLNFAAALGPVAWALPPPSRPAT